MMQRREEQQRQGMRQWRQEADEKGIQFINYLNREVSSTTSVISSSSSWLICDNSRDSRFEAIAVSYF